MSTRRYRVPAWIGVACLAVAGTSGIAALATVGADSTELSAPAASLAAAPVTIPTGRAPAGEPRRAPLLSTALGERGSGATPRKRQ